MRVDELEYIEIRAGDRERVAQAIFYTDYVHPTGARWEAAGSNVRQHYDNQARAVIQALFCHGDVHFE